jgi:hypothetical protein
MILVMERVVGIGVPSKYLDFPDLSFGSNATVTLNRASRVRPQRTKKVRRRWSTEERTPMEKAAAAGAMPKETFIAIQPPLVSSHTTLVLSE